MLDAPLHRQDPEVTTGVPQRSVFGTLMFIIFINDIGNGITENTTICLCADDAHLYRQIEPNEDHVKTHDEHSQIADVFYLVCKGNTPFHRRDAKLVIADYGLDRELELVSCCFPCSLSTLCRVRPCM